MVYDCGACIAKYLLCIWNFLFFLIGSAILAIGIWLAVESESFISLLKVIPKEHLAEFTKPAVIQQASYLLIAAGLFMFILSFLGYCGALRESRCLLKTYGICMVLIVVLQITAGGLAVAYKEKAELGTKSLLKDMLTKNYESGNKTNVVTVVWNHLQAEMHCCGVDNYKDFDVTPWKKDSGKEIPESCCVLQDKATLKPLSPGCTKNPSISNSYFENGCYKAGSELVMLHIKIVIYAGIGLGIIELLCIILPFCLSKSINQYMKY